MEQQKNSNGATYVVSQRNKKIGLFLLIGPFVGLFAIVMIYAILAFVINTSVGFGTESLYIVAKIINVILGLFGIICVGGIFIGIPLGIIYLNKEELVEGAKYDERSGKKESSIVPEEIKRWNWGSAGLTWIWGVYHGVWISLLIFIPFVNLFMWIILGIKGSEWAWKARQWESLEVFIGSQKKWKPWGIAFLIISFLLFILNILSIVIGL